MEVKQESITFSQGANRWRYNYNTKCWSTLMYGSFMGQTEVGLTYRWVSVDEKYVPDVILRKITS